MNETYTKLYCHVVFSTRNRRPAIAEVWRERLYEYMGGTLRGLGAHSIAIGGTLDHVHLLVGLRPTHRLADLMREVKHESSHWVRENLDRTFTWQAGYGAFTVSPLACERVKAYIADQVNHHRVPPGHRTT
ncbi:MAG: IS200/IS605 family transposase [Gemmatimonadota bacterium]